MVFIISVILVLIVLIIIGLFLRKRVYDSVDRLESWKMDIMNRNIAAELSRMKELNLSGETKDKFEAWRKRWESIVTTELGDIEELLYDAESSADRYRFKAARQSTAEIEQSLRKIENDLDVILKELNELLKTEEESRKGIEELEPKIKELQTHISQNHVNFARAEVRFDVEFDELNQLIDDYNELIENGEYAKGKELVDDLTVRIAHVQEEIEQFPELYKQCKEKLPRELDDLYNGLQEMKESGYRVEHLGFEKEINEYQARLLDCVHSLEKVGTEKVKPVIPEMEERIKEMYNLLEKEAIAKNYIETKVPSFEQSVRKYADLFNETKEDVERLKQAYYIEDSDLENYLTLEKAVASIADHITDLAEKIEEKELAFSQLRDLLEDGFNQLEKIHEDHNTFVERIQSLRKDEFEAREEIEKMRQRIYDTNRKLRRSNIPGVPSMIWNVLEEASAKNQQVLDVLENSPLDISDVRHALSEAKTAVDRAIDETDQMIEQAFLTERVIQYANRYRSASPSLAKQLMESERLFRKASYELALELAAKAIEEVEPGALKRIEEQIESVS